MARYMPKSYREWLEQLIVEGERMVRESEGEVTDLHVKPAPGSNTITHDRMPKPVYLIFAVFLHYEIAVKGERQVTTRYDDGYTETERDSKLIGINMQPVTLIAAFASEIERDNLLTLLKKFEDHYKSYLSFIPSNITPAP